MKTSKNILVTLSFVSTLALLAGCSKFKDFGDTNQDPTRVSVASTRALLTNALQNTLPVASFGNTTANLYAQYLSEGPYPGGSLYSTLNFDNGAWYTGALYNLKAIIDYNADPEKMDKEADPGANGSHNNQIAVARILKAFSYLHMTDRWGPIPYANALKGAEDFTPAYTDQKTIYLDLFKELKEAVAQVDNGAGPAGDIFLGGDMAAWKRFANTQRMIMALRLSKIDPALGKTEFAAAFAAGAITSNSQNMFYKYLSGDPNNFNPWYVNYSVSLRNDYAVSKTLDDYMDPLGDPRLKVYGEVLPTGDVVGLKYGSNKATNIPNAFSRIGNYFRGAGSPAGIYTYAQVLFSLAEAAQLTWIPGGEAAAAQYYNDAIKASWEQYGVYNAAAYATFIAKTEIAYTAATAIEKIITQKWVHLYLNGYEAWNEWRRTGYPTLIPAPDFLSSKNAIPRRQAYGTNEKLVNKTNYDAAVVLLGGPDDLYTRVWWDKP